MAMHDLNKHRYLSGLIRHVGDPVHAIPCTVDMRRALMVSGQPVTGPEPVAAFGQIQSSRIGIFVLRNNSDHVTVLAQPMGMNGRGGHFTMRVSFDAVLRGVHNRDSGCHVYTSDYSSRNAYRGTAFTTHRRSKMSRSTGFMRRTFYGFFVRMRTQNASIIRFKLIVTTFI